MFDAYNDQKFYESQLKEKKEFFNKNGFVIFENVLNKNDLNKVRKIQKNIQRSI